MNPRAATALAGAAFFRAVTLATSSRTLAPRALAGVRRSLGARRSGDHVSPHFRDGAFHNREPMRVVEPGGRSSIMLEFATKSDRGRPGAPVPLVQARWGASAGECAATWLGHSTVLLEVGGRWVLTDPVWSDRVSPSATLGPRRNHPVPARLEDLPALDAVLISHDHYDHLDTVTIDRLVQLQTARFVVPLGVGSHLRQWGVPADRVIELDWGQSAELDGLTLTCTEARHFSGRLFTANPTLWSSWLVECAGRRAFFGGDTGYTDAFAELGSRHGPIDLTVLPIGAYDARWPEVHMDPAEAVRAHLDLLGDVLLPIHWATFDLAFHTWAAPADWVRAEAADRGVRLAQPRPGERCDLTTDLPIRDWWSGL
jgi:L-ascorbate metabolism protein UlaG (beta-lactamase superfamily)